MKTLTSLSIAAVVAAAAFSVSAQTQVADQPLSRAQVQAEQQRARASGELNRSNDELYGAGLAQARSRSTWKADAPSAAIQATPGTVTRTDVQADLQRSRTTVDHSADEMYGAGSSISQPTQSRYAGSNR
jgi:hypothetical protein